MQSHRKSLRVFLKRDKMLPSNDNKINNNMRYYDPGMGIEFRSVKESSMEWTITSMDRYGKAMLSGIERISRSICKYSDPIVLPSGLIDIGDSLTALIGSESKPRRIASIADFAAFFQTNPTFVVLFLVRDDTVDKNGLAIMPVPAMAGPFERLRRDINVIKKKDRPRSDTGRQPITRNENRLEIEVDDNVQGAEIDIDVGVNFLKVYP